MQDERAQISRPGRRRSDASRMAILTAALALFDEFGYGALSVEGIASRSGTGKQTIYRWWSSTADVLLEALAVRADLNVPTPNAGSWAADLRAFLDASFALGRKRPIAAALRALMAQAQLDPEFGNRFGRDFLQRRRDALALIIEAAQRRGDLPGHLKPELIPDVVFGVIWYRLMATKGPLDKTLVDDLVGALANPTLRQLP